MATAHKHLSLLICALVLHKPCCRMRYLRPFKRDQCGKGGGGAACADTCFACITIVTGRYITGLQPMSSPQTERRSMMGEVNSHQVHGDLHMSQYDPRTEIMNMTAVSCRREVEILLTDYTVLFGE